MPSVPLIAPLCDIRLRQQYSMKTYLYCKRICMVVVVVGVGWGVLIHIDLGKACLSWLFSHGIWLIQNDRPIFFTYHKDMFMPLSLFSTVSKNKMEFLVDSRKLVRYLRFPVAVSEHGCHMAAPSHTHQIKSSPQCHHSVQCHHLHDYKNSDSTWVDALQHVHLLLPLFALL